MPDALLDKARKAEEEDRMKDPVARAVLHVRLTRTCLSSLLRWRRIRRMHSLPKR